MKDSWLSVLQCDYYDIQISNKKIKVNFVNQLFSGDKICQLSQHSSSIIKSLTCSNTDGFMYKGMFT